MSNESGYAVNFCVGYVNLVIWITINYLIIEDND